MNAFRIKAIHIRRESFRWPAAAGAGGYCPPAAGRREADRLGSARARHHLSRHFTRLAPQDRARMPWCNPFQWAISAYFLFTLVRLFAAYRNYLPHWFLIVSVIVDMASADVPDLEFPYPVRTTGILLSQGSDADVCLYLHRAQDPALRTAVHHLGRHHGDHRLDGDGRLMCCSPTRTIRCERATMWSI